MLTRVVCSIAPLPPPPSPRTSPTCGVRQQVRVVFKRRKKGWAIDTLRVLTGRETGGHGFNKGINAVSLVNPWCSSCPNNYSTFQILSEWHSNPQLMKFCAFLCGYLADSFHSNSSPSCCSVSISVNSVGVGVLSSSQRMWRSRSAAGDTGNIEIFFYYQSNVDIHESWQGKFNVEFVNLI